MAAQQESYIQICNLCKIPTTASNGETSVLRRAVDASGCIGSLYDARYDSILEPLDKNFPIQSTSSHEPLVCVLKKYDTDEPPHWLKCIRMHRELRLSVALKVVPAQGIAALSEYSGPVNRDTRFLCYSYHNWHDYLSDDELKRRHGNKPHISEAPATHVIVEVNWGIDAVIILQLPHDNQLAAEIDRALNNICTYLNDDYTDLALIQKHKHLLEQITYTETFSNIPDLARIRSIIDFCRNISRFKNDRKLLKPCNYKLYPIQYFYTITNGKQDIFGELEPDHVDNLENYLLQLSLKLKNLKTLTDQEFSNCQHYLKHEYRKMCAHWSNLKKMYADDIQRLRELVISVRSEKNKQNMIDQALHSNETETLASGIRELTERLNAMERKEHLIKDLVEKRFEYKNASDYDIKSGDNEAVVESKLLTNARHERIVCFDDNLYRRDKSQWHTLHGQLIKERDDNSQFRIVYVDFSYCSYELKRFIILPIVKKENNMSGPEPMAASTSTERLNSDSIFNILLLGESGAGKSTFINAFVNYLIFNKLEEAQKKPIVLIPVSFLITFDDDFKERQVTFGGTDTLSNEDHDRPGQSVTQHCKSYVFTLKDNDERGRKLRIIDTPGIGDVRGSTQDDANMQHILSYIENLTHLNAVCILMKPNNDRLNIFFRSCLIQLFDLLGEHARDKIIFCFTNARATFYAPGNTGPLLKQLLESLPVEKVPFTKKNTFCFDSESFRYLVAVQNGVKFSDSEKKEYNGSWDKSSTESKRFLEYIRTNMTASLLPGKCESMKDAQLKISLMIRPMLEAMRNILRNIVLWNAGSRREVSIELCPRIIKCTTAICLTCPRQFLEVGDFWIMADALHVFHNKCRTCPCRPNDHYPIDYQLEYQLCNHSASNSYDELTKMVDDLCEASAKFAHFLFGTENTSQNDIFLIGIERMIKEENDICAKEEPCQLNSDLLKCLKQLKKNYETKKLSAEKERIQLRDVYDKIQEISEYPMIKSQMSAVKEWHKYMIKYYEYEVPV